MSISDVGSLIGGAVLGPPVSEIFKLLIAEAKKVKDFRPLSQDLVLTMERLIPIFQEIDSMLQGCDPRMGELEMLIKTIQRAKEMISKCSRVRYNLVKKARYTTEIKGINEEFLRFCQVPLQTIMFRNQCQIMRSMPNLGIRSDLLSNTGEELMKLFLVPQPETVAIFWLDRPLNELKNMILEDRVDNVVVSAPSSCGKTMLVTKLCHDADIKGKFKQIFFITVSKSPNVNLIVHRFLKNTGSNANNLDARLSIQQLLNQLRIGGPILLVLDDVRPQDATVLDSFLIQLPDYKILLTSRFEFPRFGPTYPLDTLIDEDVKSLFTQCTAHPDCHSCLKRDHLLQKILNRSSWVPLAVNPLRSLCGGCDAAVEHERSVNVYGVLWHPECFGCRACDKPIAIHEVEKHVSNSRGKFHNKCYKRYCYVCKESKLRAFHMHPFWKKVTTGYRAVVRECNVTAILVLNGLPRLLTGYLLAHQMMHAYLRVNGHKILNNLLEEGLCQVVANMWLHSQKYTEADPSAASSSRTPPAKNGDQTEFEKRIVEFCKNQIETDESPVYGEGFRKVNHMVTNSNLQETLKEIIRQG